MCIRDRSNADEFPENKVLAHKVMNYWIQFAKTGNPNSPGLPRWPEYTMSRNRYLIFDDEITIEKDLRKRVSDTLDAVTEGIY